jgi:hypothetical protein
MARLRKAARERWNLPDAVRTEALLSMNAILSDPISTNRDRIAVARTLIAMDRTDQRDEALDLRRGTPAQAEDERIDPAIAAAALRAARESSE